MQKPHHPSLRNGLVDAWAANRGYTGKLLVSRSGNHGALTNLDSSAWVLRNGRYTMQFGGVNQSVVMATDLPELPQWSVQAWCAWNGTTITNFSCVFAGKFGTVAGNGIACIQPGKYSVLRGNNAIAATQYVSAANELVHIVSQWDGTNASLYANGVKMTTGPSDTGYGITNTRIGHGYSSNYFGGQIDDVLVYSRVITLDEIQLLGKRRGIAHETRSVPIVRGATVGGSHSLTANGIVTGDPTLGTPPLAQSHSLSATPIATGAPTLDSPALTQSHVLSSASLATGAPTLGTPTITQSGTFTAVGIATGAPTLGSPALTQSHVLSGAPVAAGAPTLGTPTLSSGGQLTADPIVTGEPTLGTPTLSQSHSLAGVAIACGAPALGIPTLSQHHQLTATSLVVGSPTLGTPTIGDPTSATIPWVTGTIPLLVGW